MTSRHRTEWLVLAVSLAAILTLVALLIYGGITEEDEPRLRIELATPVEHDGNWLVPFRLRNDGGIAATNVDVEVSLTGLDGEPTASTVTIAFAPGGSTVDGTVVFDQDPADGRLQPRILGYELP